MDGQLMLLQREGLRGLVVALSTRVFHLQYIVKGITSERRAAGPGSRTLHTGISPAIKGRTDPDRVLFTYGEKGSELGLCLIGD